MKNLLIIVLSIIIVLCSFIIHDLYDFSLKVIQLSDHSDLDYARFEGYDHENRNIHAQIDSILKKIGQINNSGSGFNGKKTIIRPLTSLDNIWTNKNMLQR